jgi:hypothetical protein
VASARFSLTLRSGPRVTRERFESLAAALDRLAAWAEEQSAGADRQAVDLRVRRFEPIQQVAARGEVAGPRRLRGGIDVRGDGSCEAWTGRWSRRLVDVRDGETPTAALARALGV